MEDTENMKNPEVFEGEESITITTIEDLKKLLTKAGIDLKKWGKDKAKTLDQFYKELKNGESVLIRRGKSGELLRKVSVAAANIYYIASDGTKYRLKEVRQVFKDGRERARELAQSVLEKMQPGESPEEAMIRGIREELGISSEIKLNKAIINKQQTKSPSYPDLLTQYTTYIYEVLFNNDQFDPEGYKEEGPDKTTYFEWEEVK